MVAAWLTGTIILNRTGWDGGVVLAAFFVSSNLVSRLPPPRQRSGLDPTLDLDAKGEQRDAWQVFANGGPAALASLIAADPSLRLWLATISLAAAAADTWATSFGLRSKGATRLLASSAVVPRGTSGGVTAAGFTGAALGAMLVSAVGALALGRTSLFVAGTLIGFAGMLVDAYAGGRWQGRFHCMQCDQPSEWRRHRCGHRTELRAGVPWLTNDGVNLLATTLALAAGSAWWAWLE